MANSGSMQRIEKLSAARQQRHQRSGDRNNNILMK